MCYKGRGLIQLTGRGNYRRIGFILGLPLEAQPELAVQPENAVRIACEYWKSRNINAASDKDFVQAVTRKVNGGLNGIGSASGVFGAGRRRILGGKQADLIQRVRGLAPAPRVVAAEAVAHRAGGAGAFGASAGKHRGSRSAACMRLLRSRGDDGWWRMALSGRRRRGR